MYTQVERVKEKPGGSISSVSAQKKTKPEITLKNNAHRTVVTNQSSGYMSLTQLRRIKDIDIDGSIRGWGGFWCKLPDSTIVWLTVKDKTKVYKKTDESRWYSSWKPRFFNRELPVFKEISQSGNIPVSTGKKTTKSTPKANAKTKVKSTKKETSEEKKSKEKPKPTVTAPEDTHQSWVTHEETGEWITVGRTQEEIDEEKKQRQDRRDEADKIQNKIIGQLNPEAKDWLKRKTTDGTQNPYGTGSQQAHTEEGFAKEALKSNNIESAVEHLSKAIKLRNKQLDTNSPGYEGHLAWIKMLERIITCIGKVKI